MEPPAGGVEGMGTDQLRNLLKLTDPLAIELIVKLDDKHSPIWSDELPTSGFPADLQLSKLDDLERAKLATSEMKEHNGNLVRHFHITPFGRVFRSAVAPHDVK